MLPGLNEQKPKLPLSHNAVAVVRALPWPGLKYRPLPPNPVRHTRGRRPTSEARTTVTIRLHTGCALAHSGAACRCARVSRTPCQPPGLTDRPLHRPVFPPADSGGLFLGWGERNAPRLERRGNPMAGERLLEENRTAGPAEKGVKPTGSAGMQRKLE